MTAILDLLQVLLFKSVLEASLQAMSEADRQKYDCGEKATKILKFCRKLGRNLTEEEKEAVGYYKSVIADGDKTFKTRLAEISESNSDCFIEILRLSGFPTVILCSSNVYMTIMSAYMHIYIMSKNLREIRLDSPDLLNKLDDYSSRLAAFTPSIISEILQELPKAEVELVTDINMVYMTGFCSFHQFFSGLMQPNSFEFKVIQAFSLLNAAMVEKDVSKWSPGNFETMKDCVCAVLGNTRISNLEKLQFIGGFVPKLIKMLEETSLWKSEGVFFSENFRIMFDNIRGFSRPGFLQVQEYTKVLTQFPDSGFPSTLEDLGSFLHINLLEKFDILKSK